MNNCEIERVDKSVYLGLTVDSELNWKSHIDRICKKLRPYVGVFRRISFLCSDKVKRMLYYAYFHAIINYVLTVWSGTSMENINKIIILQKKCMRNLFYNKYRIGNINTDDLYKEHKIIKFENMIDVELKLNFHKIIKKTLKADLKLETNNEIHKHNTRQAKNLRKIKTKNNFGKFSFTNRAISAYNVIPSPIKNLVNNETFKKYVKRIALEQRAKKYVTNKRKRYNAKTSDKKNQNLK